MKLLAKSDIAKAKGQERQRDIAEGLKLAKRTDSLREIQAAEEASLEKFRIENISRIQEEISKEISKRDALISEVDDLERRRTKALEPLDIEWVKLEVAKSEFNLEQEKLETRTKTLEERDAKLKRAEIETEDECQRVAEEKRQSSKLLQEATADRAEARNLKGDTESEKIRQEQILAQKVVQLEKREVQIATRERDIHYQNTYIQTQKESIAREWALLKDRQAMFERDINRTKRQT